MNKVLKIVNPKGVHFNVRLVEKGDKYGVNDKVTHNSDKPIVVFYDDRYKISHKELGQIVSSYYVGDIMDMEECYALNLYGGVDDWYISAENVAEIKQWLNKLI